MTNHRKMRAPRLRGLRRAPALGQQKGRSASSPASAQGVIGEDDAQSVELALDH